MYKVAPSYANATIVKIDEESHKALISEPCDRCGGHGIIASRVENGHIVPIPVDGGICYKCNGAGSVSKWVKAYTEKEYERYILSRKKAKEKKENEYKAKMQEREANSEQNKADLLVKWGFEAENPCVYVIGGGNTYNIKDELKERGGRYNGDLGWYFTTPNEVPEGYFLVAIPVDELYDWFPRTKRLELKNSAREIVKNAIVAATPSTSEFVGEIKERLRQLKVRVTGRRDFNSYYGAGTVLTFDYNGNSLVWFASSPVDEDKAIINQEYFLTGTIKDHNIYNGVKTTYINRVILKAIDN